MFGVQLQRLIDEMSGYPHLFDRLRREWAESGILAPEVATATEIAAFERRYGVTLPEDLRTYFALVNGTEIGYLGMDDEDLIGFWHLDQVKTFAEDEIEGPDASSTFIFADHSIHVITYGVRLSADPTEPTPVVLVGGSKPVVVSQSIAEFFERYLRRDTSVIFPP